MSNLIQLKPDLDSHYEMYLAHSRTMIMMFEATNELRYLDRSVQSFIQAQHILRGGYMRPLGVLLKSA